MLLADQHRSRSRLTSTSTFSSSPSSLMLARAAHSRLQFDYPSLDATAVDALSRAFSDLLKVDGGDLSIAMAPTRKLVAALAGDPPSLVSPEEVDAAADDKNGEENDEEMARAKALDAAAASSSCWDRLAVSYTVETVLSVLESLCSSFEKKPSSSPSPPPLPLLLLSRLAEELDEEGERAEEEAAAAAKRAAAATAAGGDASVGGEEAERALAAFLGQQEEKEEENASASAAPEEPEERDGDGYAASDDDDSDYDTPLHPAAAAAAAGGSAPFGGADPLFSDFENENNDASVPAAAAGAAPPSLPSAVRAMVSLVQAARARVGHGWAAAGGIELTAACLLAVKRAAAAAAAPDSESSPPLRRLGTELLLLARDSAVASPLKGAAALPALLSALGGASGAEEAGSPAALADAAELFAAVVAGWPLPNSGSGSSNNSSSSSSSASSCQSRLALARAWKDATTTTTSGGKANSINVLGSVAAALSAATGGGSLEGAKRALLAVSNADSDSRLLVTACSALAAMLRASEAAGASAEEVARSMLGSGAWRSVACLLAAAASCENDGESDEEKRMLLPLPRGALEAALLGSASSPELTRYLAASPAGKFVVEGAAEKKSVEAVMLSALFAAASKSSEGASPFSSSPLAEMVSSGREDEEEKKGDSSSVKWRTPRRCSRR